MDASDENGGQGIAPVNLHAATMQAQQRSPDGRFGRGNTYASSRPVNEFVALVRRTVDRYQLVTEIAKMACGRAPYQKVDAATRLRAAECLLDRGFGRPRQSVTLEGTGEEIKFEQRVQYVKRLVGIDPDEV